MIKLFFTILLCSLGLTKVYCQENKLVVNGHANTDSFLFNQLNENFKPTGLWFKKHDPKLGEQGFFEFGTYVDGIRNGPWYKIGLNSEMISIENYRNNILHGEAKYYDLGKLSVIGHYRGFNPSVKYDTILVKDPVIDLEYWVPIENEKGYTKHGTWQYFDINSGRMILEEEYQVDELISRKRYQAGEQDSQGNIPKRTFPHEKKNNKIISTQQPKSKTGW